MFYMGNVLAHLIGGLIFTVVAIWAFPQMTSAVLIVSAIGGIYLAIAGNTSRPSLGLVGAHYRQRDFCGDGCVVDLARVAQLSTRYRRAREHLDHPALGCHALSPGFPQPS